MFKYLLINQCFINNSRSQLKQCNISIKTMQNINEPAIIKCSEDSQSLNFCWN